MPARRVIARLAVLCSLIVTLAVGCQTLRPSPDAAAVLEGAGDGASALSVADAATVAREAANAGVIPASMMSDVTPAGGTVTPTRPDTSGLTDTATAAPGMAEDAVTVATAKGAQAVSGATGSAVGVAAKAAAPPPVVIKTPAQISCEAKRGRFVTAQSGNARSCQFLTRDSGKACTKGTDCEGACLARTMTCAPARPLFGCNDVIEDDGRRVSLCIE